MRIAKLSTFLLIFSSAPMWVLPAMGQQATVRMLEPIETAPPPKMSFRQTLSALANPQSPIAAGPRAIPPRTYYGALTQPVTLDGQFYPAGSLAELVVRRLSAAQLRISLCALLSGGKTTGIRDAKVTAVTDSGAMTVASAGLQIVGPQPGAPIGSLIRFDDIKVDTGVYAWIHPVDTPEIIYSAGDGQQSAIVRVDETIDNHKPYNHVFSGSVVRSTPMGGVAVPAGAHVTLVEANSLDMLNGDPIVQVTMTSMTVNGRVIETDPTEIHLVNAAGNDLGEEQERFVTTRGSNLSVPEGTYLRFDHVKTRVGAGIGDDGSTFVPAQVEPNNVSSFTILSIKPGLSYEQTVSLLKMQKLKYTEIREPSKLHPGDHVARINIENPPKWSAFIVFVENPDADSPAVIVDAVAFSSHVQNDAERNTFHNAVLTKYGKSDPLPKNDRYPLLERWVSANDMLGFFYRPYGGPEDKADPNPGPVGDPQIIVQYMTANRRLKAKVAALERAQQLQKQTPAATDIVP